MSQGSGADGETHFARLVRTYIRDRSVRSVEADADLPRGAVGNYLKASTAPRRMPPLEALHRMSKALGCPVSELSRAFAQDLDYPIDGPELTPDEHRALTAFRKIPKQQQALAVRVLDAFAPADGDGPAGEGVRPVDRGHAT